VSSCPEKAGSRLCGGEGRRTLSGKFPKHHDLPPHLDSPQESIGRPRSRGPVSNSSEGSRRPSRVSDALWGGDSPLTRKGKPRATRRGRKPCLARADGEGAEGRRTLRPCGGEEATHRRLWTICSPEEEIGSLLRRKKTTKEKKRGRKEDLQALLFLHGDPLVGVGWRRRETKVDRVLQRGSRTNRRSFRGLTKKKKISAGGKRRKSHTCRVDRPRRLPPLYHSEGTTLPKKKPATGGEGKEPLSRQK